MARPSTEPAHTTRKLRVSAVQGTSTETEPRPTWNFTIEEFKRRYENDPNELFASLDLALEDQEQIINDLKQKIVTKDSQIDKLITKRDEYQEAFTRLSLQQQLRSAGSPTPEAARKTVKLLDPPVLTDGKDPEFEDWLSRIKNKLIANADHYGTEALKMAYVENRTGRV